ncbi:MAG: hypothetical protein ACU0CA_00825 [Paracoccaceae bacterium]
MKNVLLFVVLSLPLSVLVLAQSAVDTRAEGILAPANGFCIVNAAEVSYLFATETREGARQLLELAPGEHLCADGTAAADGIVSVFKNADGFEGCSRIVPTGTAEKMTEYAEFDRCGWSSHDS